jgi:predicted PurR-regulated permease PerM
MVQQLYSSISEQVGGWASRLASSGATAMFTTASTIGTFLLIMGVSIVVGFWVLKDLPRFGTEVHKLVGPTRSEDLRVITSAFTRSLGGYLRGMVVSCLCTGTLAFIVYSIIGLPYPLVLAFFTGLRVFIPFIGPTIAWIFAGIVGFFISPVTGILAAGLTFAAQLFNDNFISPRVMSGNVELHPAIILVVIFIGASRGGVFGMLCAVPLAAATKTIFVYYFEKRTGRQLVSEKGALFRGHPASHTDPVTDSSDGILLPEEPGPVSQQDDEPDH